MAITNLDALAARLRKLNLYVVGMILVDPDTGVLGRILDDHCPEKIRMDLQAMWGGTERIELPK